MSRIASLALSLLLSFTAALPTARGQEAAAPAPTTGPAAAPVAAVTADDPTQAIGQLRQELIDSFNNGDLDRLLSHLDADVVITWQNGEVCRGPAAVRAYYDKMMKGPERRVEKVAADPKVDDRHVYGDWAVSWGSMNDHFTLTDGSELAMNSRFTATIARRGEVWKVTSFHASVNAFDNPILGYAAKKAGTWSLVIGAVVGLLIGAVMGLMISRSRRGTPSSTARGPGAAA
jgi:ketosteroid isomerase-like protein